MLEKPACVVCNSSAWDVITVKSYSQTDTPNDDYTKVRHEVLFNLWFPGQATVHLESILCRRCGFLCYQPRPEEEDIDQKYSYLASHETASTEFGVEKASDSPRARELSNYLSRYTQETGNSILDYGGGNGRLLRYLVEKGHNCSVLDLLDETLPGVNYAGSNLQDLSGQMAFDLVICSHVLEHLANPLATLKELVAAVKSDGFIYIEVPNEIWGTPPPSIDPVTHINFFSPDSLRVLMERAGIEVLRCHYESFTRPNSMTGVAVKAIGKPAADEQHAPQMPGDKLARSQMYPGIFKKALRIARYPRLLRNFLGSHE